MKILSFQFSGRDQLTLAMNACNAVRSHSDGSDPELIMFHYSIGKDLVEVREIIIQEFPKSQILGCSSDNGIVSSNQSYFNSDMSVVITAFFDSEGSYGVSSGMFGINSNESIKKVISNALVSANRVGELPKLIYFLSLEMDQKEVIYELEEFFGTSVPICGGTPGWCHEMRTAFDQNNIIFSGNYVVVLLMYPNCEVKSLMSTVYQPTQLQGIVSRVEDGKILEIDYHSAFDIYTKWLNKCVPSAMFEDYDNYVTEMETLYPIGIRCGTSRTEMNFQVFHISGVSEHEGIETSRNFQQGERITLMQYDEDVKFGDFYEKQLLTYKTTLEPGSTVYGVMSLVSAGYRSFIYPNTMQFMNRISIPIFGFFSSSEHGKLALGKNRDSNYMVETVIFYDRN